MEYPHFPHSEKRFGFMKNFWLLKKIACTVRVEIQLMMSFP